jgi:hypothetical protein
LLFRWTKSFQDEKRLTTLYRSLVRSVLEYGSVLWNPNTIYNIEPLERVQKKFLRFIGYKRRIVNTPNNQTIISLQFDLKLSSLSTRRKISDISFLYKPVNGLVSCPPLLERILFHVPQYYSRSCPTFHLETQRTNYDQNSPLNRLFAEGNASKFYFFFNSLSDLKRHFYNF